MNENSGEPWAYIKTKIFSGSEVMVFNFGHDLVWEIYECLLLLERWLKPPERTSRIQIDLYV